MTDVSVLTPKLRPSNATRSVKDGPFGAATFAGDSAVVRLLSLPDLKARIAAQFSMSVQPTMFSA